MSTVVVSFRDRRTTFHSAEKWYVDPSGRLHVTGTDRDIAVFNVNVWDSAVTVPDSGPQSTRTSTVVQDEWDRTARPAITKENR